VCVVSRKRLGECRIAIKRARKAVGLSQLDLGKILRVPEVKISRLETGRDALSRDIALRIHSALSLYFKKHGGNR